MVVQTVSATHLRCHEYLKIDCAAEITILSGPNGSGKTSVLEAISLCSLGTSFVPVADSSIIMSGYESCVATIDAISDVGTTYHVGVEVQQGMRKKISSTHGANLTVRDLIGEMPMVALSPDHKAITFGGPAERRSFLDALMAQCSRRYTELLYEHRRVLKHRNALLSEGGGPELGLWTQKFIELSAEIILRRSEFINGFVPIVDEEYKVVSNAREAIALKYIPDSIMEDQIPDSTPKIIDALSRQWQSVIDRERVRETTLFGPQKDELQLLINSRSVKETASQGQHKSLLIALKLAECRVLHEEKNERPIVLLDDVFSELDAERSGYVLKRILELGMQCFITTTDAKNLLDHIRINNSISIKLYQLETGRITAADLTNVASERSAA